jgi:hypothetical protein
MDTARLRLHRRRSPKSDRFRAYKVAVDGKVVGSIRYDEEQTFDVAPGLHDVRLRLDWCRSEPVSVDLTAGGEARLSCRGRNPLHFLYWATLGRNRYIVLEPATT